MSNEIENREVWDAAFAKTLLGQVALVGLTKLSADDEVIEQRQLFGRVVSVDPRSGICLSLEGQRAGERFSLPPDTRPIDPAPPGEYKLRSTGELVVNPDFLITYTIRMPISEAKV